MTLKIISGGQTGADYGGLLGARDAGVRTGGTAPRGWGTEAGPRPSLADYGLVESASSGWTARTQKNVADADVTVIVGNPKSPGSRLTLQACVQRRRPVLCVPYAPDEVEKQVARIVEFLLDLDRPVLTVNVAGNRESVMPGIEGFTRAVVGEVCRRVGVAP